MNPYKLPLKTASAEFIEKKSRFIGHIARVSSAEEALEFLRVIRSEHKDANHNVYAYRIKEGNIYRHSDDGEPSGTAGMPLLDVFLKQDVYDFCCVGTRYFGGIMLGGGGLIRAYSRTASIALEAAGIGIMREVATCRIVMPYSLYEQVKRLIAASGAQVDAEKFEVNVEMDISLPAEGVDELGAKITELTADSVRLEVLGSSYQVFGE